MKRLDEPLWIWIIMIITMPLIVVFSIRIIEVFKNQNMEKENIEKGIPWIWTNSDTEAKVIFDGSEIIGIEIIDGKLRFLKF